MRFLKIDAPRRIGQLLTTFVILSFSCLAGAAVAATVSLDFEGQGRLLPLGNAEQTFTRKLGSDVDFIQFRDSTTVNTGTVSSNVTTDIAFDFKSSIALRDADKTQIKFKLSNMDASYQTIMSYREKKDVVFRWNPINIPIGPNIRGGSQRETILDEGGSLRTQATGTNLSFLSPGPVVPTLSDTDDITFNTPLVPVPNNIQFLSFATSATVTGIHESNLFLGQLSGKLVATHRVTGLMREQNFALRNGEVLVDFDLAETGTWDLVFESLDIENVLFSDLKSRAIQRAAVYSEIPGVGLFGGGCRDPFNKNDNPTFGCFFEAGAEFLNVELEYFDNAPSRINYALTQGGSIGSITVGKPAIAPVPLPAGFPLYLVGLGALALLRRGKRIE
ncbi:hypothetical protein AAFO92_14655 [Roseovarius sp. CAU 1744]|uniref:hypothetical protein n=1 Tax=Roseovarius sp. CAU 1744 TaxID=3140368 RepID=UPI00325BEDE2